MTAMTFTINLRKRLIDLHAPRRKLRSVGILKEEIARFAKADINEIVIHKDLNRYLMVNARKMPKLKVSVEKSAGKVDVMLPGTKIEAPAKKTEAKTEKETKEAQIKKVESPAPKVEAKAQPKAPEAKKTESKPKTEEKDKQQKTA